MNRTVKKRRGSPIHVRSGDHIISLVPEVAVRDLQAPFVGGPRMRTVRPSAVYLIDDRGVRRLAFGRGGLRFLLLMLLSVAWAPVRYWVASRGRGSDGR